jgi:DNA-directed RNA polymerase beta subunit
MNGEITNTSAAAVDVVKECDRDTDNIQRAISNPFAPLSRAYFNEYSFIRHHIVSYNELISPGHGIPHMITKIFKTEDLIDYMVADNQGITHICIEVEFDNCKIMPPIQSVNNTLRAVYPNEIKQMRGTYQSRILTSVTFKLSYLTAQNVVIKTVTQRLNDFEIGHIPTMVKSQVCNLSNVPRAGLLDLDEDPNDPGGYFIIEGREYVICSAESVQYNAEHVHNNMYKTELSRTMYISRAGGISEHSYQLIIRYLNSGEITFEICYSYMNGIQIPFYILYRMFNISNDRDIINFIVSDSESQSALVKILVGKLVESMISAPISTPMFKDLKFERDSNKILNVMSSNLLSRTSAVPQPASTGANKSRYNAAARYNNNNSAANQSAAQAFLAGGGAVLGQMDPRSLNYGILSSIDKWLLPHIGVTVDDRIAKLRDIGVMIYNLLLVTMGIKPSTSKDSYMNKRIQTAGHVMTAPIRKSFNNAIIKPMKAQFRRTLGSFAINGNDSIKDVFISAVKPDDFKSAIIKAIRSGSSDVMMNGRKVSESIPAIDLERKNSLFFINSMRTILPTTRNTRSGGKSIATREVHPSFIGFICIVQSAETGDKVGKVKQMAINSFLSTGVHDAPLKDMLRNDPDIMQLDRVTNKQIYRRNMRRIRVNGFWIGVTALNVNDLALKYRNLRRQGKIHCEITIYVEQMTQELQFWTDAGRMLRPLLITHDTDHGRDTVMTSAHLRDLICGRLKFSDLLRTGVVEFVAPDEQDNTYIADCYDRLRLHAHDPTRRFTHCELPESLLGIAALVSPMAQHTYPTRVSYMTNQTKQACGIPQLLWLQTTAKHYYVMYMTAMPLAKTIVNNHLYSNGDNLIVAYTLNNGRGMEDASTGNIAAFDRGKFSNIYLTNETVEIADDEVIQSQIKDADGNVANIKFDKLDASGIMRIGVVAEYNDVMLCKYVKMVDADGRIKYRTAHIIYKHSQAMRLKKIHVGSDHNNKQFYRFMFYAHQPIAAGDKIASREGNKHIITDLISPADMPFTEDGVIPDIIVNPLSFPKRMIIGQPIEGLIEKLCAAMGTIMDVTSFSQIDYDKIRDLCDEYGVENMGAQKLYDGVTGKAYYANIFICPTSYQRLQKFARTQMHALSDTHKDPISGQPVQGRGQNGGLRLGEMEKDALNGHGVTAVIDEKYHMHSDGRDIPICRNCNITAIFRDHNGASTCHVCGSNAALMRVPASWFTRYWELEMTGAHVGIQYHLEPAHFYQAADRAAGTRN